MKVSQQEQQEDSLALNKETSTTPQIEDSMIDNSPEALEMRAFQENIDNGSEALEMQAYQDKINVNPENEKPDLPKKNTTGIPDNIKHGIESLSGLSLDDVKVHYNSKKPIEFDAHAYTEGNNVYIGAGQEEYLPHELWHVIQQKQGKVKAETKEKGKKVNSQTHLEVEAEEQGEKSKDTTLQESTKPIQVKKNKNNVIQKASINHSSTSKITHVGNKWMPDENGDERSQTFADTHLYPSKHVIENSATLMTTNSVELMGGHILPARWGGNGSYPNVLPWSKGFEKGAWEQREVAIMAALEKFPQELDLEYELKGQDNEAEGNTLIAMLNEVTITLQQDDNDSKDVEEIITTLINHVQGFKTVPKWLAVRTYVTPNDRNDMIREDEPTLLNRTKYEQDTLADYGQLLTPAKFIEDRLINVDNVWQFKEEVQHLG